MSEVHKEKIRPAENRADFRKSYMSDRGLFEYVEILGISEKELNNPETVILDLGAGARQLFAREAQTLHLKAWIISVDPRLALPTETDLNLPGGPKEERRTGRQQAADDSLAASAEALPFKDGVIEKIYALFSIPYYLDKPEQIQRALGEMLRILKPGGIIKMFPIMDDQIEIVSKFLLTQDQISFEREARKSLDPEDQSTDWLITVQKTVL